MNGYYLGLDMGTSTVGWAVTDENYKLLKKKGKNLWGVREFEPAQSAAARRMQRVSRRKLQREQARIGLLKEYFADAILSIDPNFYMRLENSKYHLEDKVEGVRTPNALFNDKNYKDKDYFKQYPTIFHLRRELIDNPKEHDVRLVFLALLNMFKHRGHFLNAGSVSDDSTKMDMAYLHLTELLDEIDVHFAQIDPQALEEILSDRDCSHSAKAAKIAELLGLDKKQKRELAFVKTICGLKGDAKALFDLEDLESKVEIQFSSFNYDEKEPEIQAAVGG